MIDDGDLSTNAVEIEEDREDNDDECFRCGISALISDTGLIGTFLFIN